MTFYLTRLYSIDYSIKCDSYFFKSISFSSFQPVLLAGYQLLPETQHLFHPIIVFNIHDYELPLFRELHNQTTQWLGLNIGFWVSLAVVALIVVVMNLVFWGMKPKKF